jgi:hypothetical protein
VVATLLETIRDHVAAGHYIIGQHAAERLDERGILEWQIVDGIEAGRLLSERPGDLPNPAVEVEQVLADGTKVKAVWSFIVRARLAKLVTVHFFDE